MLKKTKGFRIFFGLPIPENKAAFFRKLIIENNPGIEDCVKWVKAGNHHITIQFLGNVDKERISIITSAVDKALACVKPFNVVLRNIVPFPNREGQTVAVNIQPSLELQKLHDEIALIMLSENFSSEKRVYSPHITMFRDSRNVKLKFKSFSLNNEEIKINKLICYKSLPEAGGSVYVPLHTLSFDQ